MGDDAQRAGPAPARTADHALVGLDLDLDEGGFLGAVRRHRAARTRPQTHASGGGLCSSVRSSSPGRWVRPWPGAPRCWPRLTFRSPACPAARSCGRRAPSTAPPRSHEASQAGLPASRSGSATSSRPCAGGRSPGTAILIVAFWRRDLRRRPAETRRLQRVQRLRQRLPDRPKPGKLGLKCLPDRAKLGRLNRQRRFPGLQLPHGPAQTGVLLAQHVHRRLLAPRPPQGRTQLGSLVGRQLRQRRPDRPELDQSSLQGLPPGLGSVQSNAQPEDLLRQRPNPVRLIAQPSQRRAVLNVLVVLPAYGLLVPLRRLLLTSQPLPQTGELPVQPGYLLTQLTSFRAQRLDRGLLVLRLLQGRAQPAPRLVCR